MSLTDAGLEVERLETIIARMKANTIAAFGPNTNVDEDSVFGQLISIFAAELVSPNELALHVYDSFNRDQAEGAQLDNLASLIGIERQDEENSNGTLFLLGDDGTDVPEGSIIETSDTGIRFVTLADATIVDVALATGSVTFADNSPAADTITRTTGSFIEDGLAEGATIIITSSASNNKTVTVASVTALTATLIASDELTNEGPVAATLTCPKVEVAVESEEAGPFAALSQAIDTIVSEVSGWNAVVNAEDITPGSYRETDLELRIRMEQSQQATGAGVDGAIEAQMLELAEVEYAKVWSNRSDAVVDGRPPHSFELVIHPDTGDQDYRDSIAALLFNLQPAGIEAYGSSSFTVTDPQGYSQTVAYSFATEVNIYFEIDVTRGADYPDDGDDQIVAALVAEGLEQGVGDDVRNWKYVSACDAIAGITDITVKQGFASSPTLTVNLGIGETQIADIDSSRIVVNS